MECMEIIRLLPTTDRKTNLTKAQLEADPKLLQMANITEAMITVRTRKVLASVGQTPRLMGLRLALIVELNPLKIEATKGILMQRMDRNMEMKHL
jgi:hypothetical protein